MTTNQQNAQHSTGPKTPEGKEITRMNALRHGYAGHAVLICEADQPAFQSLFERFRNEYDPHTETETVLVQSLAQLSWSMSHMRAQETTLTSLFTASAGNDSASALLGATGVAQHIKSLDLLSIYEQRKSRLFHQTRKELSAIQAERRAREQAVREQPAQAQATKADTREQKQSQSPNGFVCLEEKSCPPTAPKKPSLTAEIPPETEIAA